jgi:hypothetical protein
VSPKLKERRAVFDLGSIAIPQSGNTRRQEERRGSGKSPDLTYFLVFILVYWAIIAKNLWPGGTAGGIGS